MGGEDKGSHCTNTRSVSPPHQGRAPRRVSTWNFHTKSDREHSEKNESTAERESKSGGVRYPNIESTTSEGMSVWDGMRDGFEVSIHRDKTARNLSRTVISSQTHG